MFQTYPFAVTKHSTSSGNENARAFVKGHLEKRSDEDGLESRRRELEAGQG